MAKPETTCWYVYMVLTEKQFLYTGIATDIERRFQEHCDIFQGLPAAKGAKYFRGNQPLKIVYQEQHSSRSSASKREAEIKRMTRQQKQQLIGAVSKQ